MNRRAKGQRRELQAQRTLEAQGYTVFRLYQPAFAKQGPVDMIAIRKDRIRFIQVRSNRAGNLMQLERVACARPGGGRFVTWEVWVYKDGIEQPTVREI